MCGRVPCPPQAFAASIPATVQAIRIPAENLDVILPGGLGMETIDLAVMRRIEKAIHLEKAFVEVKWEGSLSKAEPIRIDRLYPGEFCQKCQRRNVCPDPIA